MDVEFRRTGERRYALAVHRKDLPPFEIGGPGYDPIMPHDLQHFIVESELGLTHGIFGFLAAGGDAGGAPHLGAGEPPRAATRRRAKAARRDRKLLRRGGRDDGPASERATSICWYEWLRRSRDPERRARAAALAERAKNVLAVMPAREREAFTEELFTRVCARMDELSARWADLDVGESFSVAWTVPAGPRRRHP